MEAISKTLATKEDILIGKNDVAKAIASFRDELAKVKSDLTKQIDNSIMWMFVFWLAQVIATFTIFSLILKK